jgi:signal transduction histidine kinase
MYTRLHGRDEFVGTGIGLAICRRIAERHGGRIYVDSSVDGGAAFHTLLPDAPAVPGTPRGAAAA